jgi:hypothetical protein
LLSSKERVLMRKSLIISNSQVKVLSKGEDFGEAKQK